jgi:predicted  nucleic acid-binding Zn-ribbon protein
MASVKDFSVEEKLVNLYRLQRVDSSIDEIEILRGELPMEVKDLEDEVLGLQNRQTRIEEEINGITEFIDEKKAAIKTSEELIAKYEKQSENVKNNREF